VDLALHDAVDPHPAIAAAACHQLGNIDYAIVIGTRFSELKDKMDHEQAMIETINFAFPTILTSGTIMAVSGTLIGQMTSDACIVGIGQCLGRGTIISIFLVLFVLPQILLVGSKIVDKTSFAVPKLVARSSGNGRMRARSAAVRRRSSLFFFILHLLRSVVIQFLRHIARDDGQLDVTVHDGVHRTGHRAVDLTLHDAVDPHPAIAAAACHQRWARRSSSYRRF